MCVPSFSIIEMSWFLPKHCFYLVFSQTFAVLYGFNDLFLVVFTDFYLYLSPNCLESLGIFNVVCWCVIPLVLPVPLSWLFGTC